MENRMMDKGLEGWNTMEQEEEDILDRKVVVVVVRMEQRKKSPSKVVVEAVRRGACLVHSPQREVGECAHHNDHHRDSHNPHNNHQTHSHRDQGKVDHTLDEEEVCETYYHGHLVLLGVVVGHVVDHRNHVLLVCHLLLLVYHDLCHGMNRHLQDVLNDHLYPLSNGQNELEEVEHDSRV
jgi:hypothetical protein